MGRSLLPEREFEFGRYAAPAFRRRREVLRETLAMLEGATARGRYHARAEANHARWQANARPQHTGVRVLRGDWGEVTAALSREFGVVFAALNMANAYVPGGGYIEGTAAQEENMFRRSDCHFALDDAHIDPRTEHYTDTHSALLNAAGGRVLLDAARPRVCLRGPEVREREDLGYAWLPDDELFLFYELRAAAMDLRRGQPFDSTRARARIAAQLDTLIEAGLRHVVLSAFGCGAFRNPAPLVAALYQEELEARPAAFDCVAFAIHGPGYGPDNFTPFEATFTST